MSQHQSNSSKSKLLFLSLAALGVVYGDIGTSPLYAINEIFFGHGRLPVSPSNVFGSISLVLWALTVIISFKYVVYVLRADNDGEGGVFALSNLIKLINKGRFYFMIVISTLLVFAAGLLFGDGIITPAISVVSAVEGLTVITPSLEQWVAPITILILTALFVIQKKGTAKVGTLFGPIISVWFVVIAALGIKQIVLTPSILAAFNPKLAFDFLIHTRITQIALVLGSVMLTVTGGEAMYADMGHFGKKPIRLSWFGVVYPALILNYLGQGAFLLSGKEIVNHNLFYSMVPSWGIYPMVALATMATVIASQALISGAFSLASQAVTLGYFPRLKIVHTHQEFEGQKYVPLINWSLYAGAVLLVLMFKTSSNLASAYGLAVSGVMMITTLAMFAIARYQWNWSRLKTVLIFTPLLLIDMSFFSANILKIFEGGFVPLGIGLGLWGMMKVWEWGREQIKTTYKNKMPMSVSKLVRIKEKAESFIPRSIVIMTSQPITSEKDVIPPLKQVFWERYGVLPKHLIFLNVNVTSTPYVKGERHEIYKFYEDRSKGSIVAVTANFGFMERLDVEDSLLDLARHKEIHIDEHPQNWLIHIQQEKLLLQKGVLSKFKRARFKLFRFMYKNADSADHYFGLGNKLALTVEITPVVMGN